MRNILARLDVKPQHPSQDEMAKRLRGFKRKLQKQEQARLLATCDSEGIAQRAKREGKAAKWALLKRNIVSLLKDIDTFVDFCLARYIVWRETRGGRKRGAR